MTKFSIIIPCRSITDFLRESIPYIKKQKYKDFEVIIVLDNPEEFDFEDKRFKIITSKSGEPAIKRNLAAKNAKGEILTFLDDDAFPSEDWLNNAATHFSNPDVYALGGPAVTPKNADFIEKILGLILESFLTSGDTKYRHIPSKKREISDFPSVNLFVRKKVFKKVGGFHTEFWPGEDTKLCLDIVKNMKRPFIYAPDILVFHHRRNDFQHHLKQVSRYGKHRGYFSKVYPETSRLPSYYVPSVFVLFLIFGFVLSLLNKLFLYMYISILGIYFILLIFESLKAYLKYKKVKVIPYFIIGVILTHIVYGSNFIVGLIKKPKLKVKKYNVDTGNYMEG